MIIPDSFKTKVIGVFGDKGREWLETLPGILEACIQKWQLYDCSLSEILSMNLICFAASKEYGDVALKIGVPHSDLFSEMKSLMVYNSSNICRCYDQDYKLGAMLLEKVSPGYDLNKIENGFERIDIASDLISRLPIPLTEDCGLPTYEAWMKRAFHIARTENKVGARMLSHISEAEKLYEELNRTYNEKFLLHGDLHHENILFDNRHGWKAIDPKGVAGMRCLEAARFIENEIEKLDFDYVRRIKYLDQMSEAFGFKLKVPKRDIAVSVFVLEVLSICWSFEEYEVPSWIKYKLEDLEIFLDYVKDDEWNITCSK